MKPANPAGRVRHDKSGRAIWEWAVDTGRHALDSTSRLLKRLDSPGLALEEEAKKKAREEDPLAGSPRGFNPYDSRNPAPGRATPQPKAHRPESTRKAGLFSRLFGGGR